MVELRNVTFENVHKVLQLKPEEHQRTYVEDVSTTIALAYAGINEQCPGECCVIYYENEPVGVLLDKVKFGNRNPPFLDPISLLIELLDFLLIIITRIKELEKRPFKKP